MLNRTCLMGRLTRDPELRNTQTGIPVCSFSIACDRNFKNANGERETDFFDCVAWRQTAEFVSRHFTKGRMAVVEGRLQNRDWTDKEGNKRRTTELIVDNAYFGDSSPRRMAPVSLRPMAAIRWPELLRPTAVVLAYRPDLRRTLAM